MNVILYINTVCQIEGPCEWHSRVTEAFLCKYLHNDCHKIIVIYQEQIQRIRVFFQEHVPLLSTLCNPGLRKRHWKAMSASVGYDIAPDSSTTLRKMLKNSLAPYMEEFEGISGGASKVRIIIKIIIMIIIIIIM